ncbi:MAG TPA: hypothetical protein VFV75_02080 [Candidatus Polarisedimenticolaceae bacterium]|nr:hypothetical protein [Candidatus Polarisedimenticolaceae bacterium]
MLVRTALVLSLALLAAQEEPPPPSPLDLGVTEETGTALAQIDVTLTGPPEALAQVRREGFQLWVGGKKVETFTADAVCPTATPRPPDRTEESPVPQEAPVVRPATWLVYFDQWHLTQSGRARAIQLAKDTLAQILNEGDRAAVVSNGRSLVTLQPFTESLDALLAALARLEKDVTQFETYASDEEWKLQNILEPGRQAGDRSGGGQPTLDRMIRQVRLYAEEERWRTQRDLARLGMAIGRLADVDAPKAVLYFADTTRRNAGDHYLSFLSASTVAKNALATNQQMGTLESQTGLSIGGELSFDRVVKEAAALGIRFYTVEAQPLQESSVRVHDAQKTLQSLAVETGGKAFINGVTPKRMVGGIKEDFGCLWLLSFDPTGLPTDVALPVRVLLDVPKVKVRARGQTVVQSAQQRVTNRLLAHFAVETESAASPLRAGFVPLAWKDGKFSALLQVVAPPTALPGATWDLGASVVAIEKIAAETSARTQVAGSNVAVALESVVELKPGPFELVAVARELTSDKVFSSRTEGTWPDPEDALAEVVQPVVLQPGPGAFTRDGMVRKSGSLVHRADDPLDAARPTALVALVCRSKMVKTSLDVTRVLEGASPVEFPPLALDLKDERCGQVRDMIPARSLGPGRYHYRIVVREKGTVIGNGETTFLVE